MPLPATPNVEEIAEELREDLEDVDRGDEQTMQQEAVEELGALNVEAVQANRHRDNAVRKKRGGATRVSWGLSNACLMYDSILKLYPASSLAMLVERLTGTPASWYLTSQPLNGQELYKSILQQCHGRAPETQYKVTVQDAASQQYRGIGRLTLPSTVNDPALGAPQQPYPPGVYPGQPAYAPMPPAVPQPQPAPAAVPYMVPQPQQAHPSHPDIAQILALQKQLSDISAVLQQLQGRGVPVAAQPAPVAAPAAIVPGLQAPPGYAIVLANGQQVLVPISQLGLGGVPPAAAAPAAAAPPPAPPPPTPQQQFASAVGTLSDAVKAVENLRSTLLPQGAAAAPATAEAEKDPEYIKATKLGDMTIVQNRDNGDFLPIETVLANGDKIMSWVKEQRQLLAGQQPATNGAAQQQASGGQMAPPTIPVQGP